VKRPDGGSWEEKDKYKLRRVKGILRRKEKKGQKRTLEDPNEKGGSLWAPKTARSAKETAKGKGGSGKVEDRAGVWYEGRSSKGKEKDFLQSSLGTRDFTSAEKK